MSKTRHGIVAVAGALMLGGGIGAAQAAIVAAYEDIPMGIGATPSATFNITQNISTGVVDLGYVNATINITPTSNTPVLKLFETDGVATTLLLTETLVNNTSQAWARWDQAIWEEAPSVGYGPFNPGPNVLWQAVTSSDPVYGGTAIIDNSLGVASFVFDTPVLPGDSVTFLIEVAATSTGVEAFTIAEMPVAVPVPAAVWLMVSGILGVAAVGRRRA